MTEYTPSKNVSTTAFLNLYAMAYISYINKISLYLIIYLSIYIYIYVYIIYIYIYKCVYLYIYIYICI